MKLCSIALLASTATAFAPNSLTRVNKNGFSFKTQHQPLLHLLPDPSVGNEMANLTVDSALSSSSITTSNIIDGFVSNVGGLILIAGVGAGVYSTALQEKHAELQDQLNDMFQKDTGADSAAPVVKGPVKAVEVVVAEPEKEVAETVAEEAVEVVEEVVETVEEAIEEMGDITGEVLAAIPAPVPPTSEKVLKETEKAIAEVKAKGVQETKAKMSFNEPSLSPPTPSESVAEPKKEVAKTEKNPTTKKQIAQGVTLIVAAVGVALARNVIKAWLGRGMF